MNNKARGD